jgi:HEAT repeat protein
MRDIEKPVGYYIGLLHAGAREEAFFGLLDLGPEALPLLMSEAVKPTAAKIRSALVEVIWQYRQPAVIDFLGRHLTDSDPDVWKQALDGLVAIGGPNALHWVGTTMEGLDKSVPSNGLSAEWLQEAMQQIQEFEARPA